MRLGTIIDRNLFAEALDVGGREVTLLPDEKCKYCGRELLSQRSEEVGFCATCRPRGDKRLVCWLNGGMKRGAKCNLRTQDPDFNYGYGEKFYHAFYRAIKRGDFNV